jgi:hypothetical protein
MLRAFLREYIVWGIFYGLFMALFFGVMNGFTIKSFIINFIVMSVTMTMTMFFINKWSIKKLNTPKYNRTNEDARYKMKVSVDQNFEQIRNEIDQSIRYKVENFDNEKGIIEATTRYDGSSILTFEIDESEGKSIVNIVSRPKLSWIQTDYGANYTNLLEVQKILNATEIIPEN